MSGTSLFVKGNEALARGALAAGLDCYFGYPITPQNDIPEFLSAEMPKLGKVFLQSESEVASINMVLGAAAMGKMTMTTSSSPGISLMQEGISYLAGSQLPAVIVNVNRGGPGIGDLGASQGDYFQSTPRRRPRRLPHPGARTRHRPGIIRFGRGGVPAGLCLSQSGADAHRRHHRARKGIHRGI